MKHLVYIADDEIHIRNLIEMFFQSGGYDTATFDSGDALLQAFEQRPAELVVLDVMMPGTDGLAVCTRLRQISDTFIIIVSARDSEFDRITGLTLGSDDYLTKPFSPMELVARANALFRRRESANLQADADTLSYAGLLLRLNAREATLNGVPLDLTPTEYDLMVYMARNREKAISRTELLRHVWRYGSGTEVDTRATDDTVKRLRKKLVKAGASFSIDSVWGFGFKLTQKGPHDEDPPT
ncbi:response regulator transcription factor [Ethanoligenens harbinense]|uniref:Stage 0 sporulation protein A homolog n=1 Tax=Ethanoligenens harbinense (strain DSM 18485 / JCM 12961 / CGMCC 1.5033 / YUAN-3) TaxID=663278 RepID=E6U3X5_ETHHY|nr:response regulator transcription factor [Ethanoligenens harbinense]ADU27655.1 two component transcriptional regulator, winged helix family [Ethanoligenens harbinense YUAN-3]AVQ96691.1 DNA-binding response regulator [Ethanoligenens harbinense YUAN-3]AYF39351.1 DNA-binding response regulator [Ethanoligenens harbinense]AYF42176.1 DNA-binding response regulator [Ethanoligenens harbinense]QCN92931.1 DNA-binding response regulator [Ethanoligenens harbinense]